MSTPAIVAWEALFRAQVRVLRALHAEFPDEILSFNEYDVLFTVAREPGHQIRMRALTRNVLLSQSSVSRLVDRLVMRDLLSKHEDPRDGRGAVVQMTERGEIAFREVAEEHGRSINRLMNGALDSAELKQLERITKKLQDAVPDVGPNAVRVRLDSPVD